MDKVELRFSFSDAKSLLIYLESVRLLLKCKSASVRVSKREWQAIESRLLA
ncbi:hypothetical protein, partial [Okeania sp. SIO2B9]|uniref:NACHT C-terminal helical domain 2-containing protein n=1 Tax=Okeania sp. SIO2B9 TaxID=2607782 RepID=UPI0035C93A13